MQLRSIVLNGQRCLVAVGVVLSALPFAVASGCGNREQSAAAPASQPSPPGSTPEAAVPSDADLQGQLRAMTQAVRKFSLEKQRAPTSLEEVVAAGYIRTLPAAPSGMKFAISRSTVVLVKQ